MKPAKKLESNEDTIVDKNVTKFLESIERIYDIPVEILCDLYEIPAGTLYPLNTANNIKEALNMYGINRARIICIDHSNVEIQVPWKHVETVKKIFREYGVAGVHYPVRYLWFFRCRFKKFQVI